MTRILPVGEIQLDAILKAYQQGKRDLLNGQGKTDLVSEHRLVGCVCAHAEGIFEGQMSRKGSEPLPQ